MHTPCSACRRAIPVRHFIRKRDIHGGMYARAHCPHCRKRVVRRGKGFLDIIKKIGSIAKPLAGLALPLVSRAIGARYGPGAGVASSAIGSALLGSGLRRRRRTGRSFMPAGFGIMRPRGRIGMARRSMTGGRRRRTGRGFFDVVRKIGSFVRPFAKPLASFALPYASRAIGARFGPGAGAASLGIGKALGLGMRRRRKGRGFLSDTLGSLGLGLPRYRAHFSRMV